MYRLSENLRPEMRIPFGTVISGNKPFLGYLRRNKIKNIVTVGDACSRMLVKSDFIPKIMIIDEKIRRKKVKWNFKTDAIEFHARSRAGTISEELFDLIKKISRKRFSKPVLVRVKGEEDLAVLPVVKFFPTGYFVVYGLFTKSVILKIDKASKKKMGKFLYRMKV